jgi:aminoglycoside phosphotransferase (APT) family kinase protein
MMRDVGDALDELVRAAIAAAVGAPIERIEPTELGESRSTWFGSIAGEPVVIKLVDRRDDTAERLSRLLRLVAQLGVAGSPVPAYLAAGVAGDVGYTVQRRVEGVPLEPAPGLLPSAEVIRSVVPELLAAIELQRDAGDLADPPWPGWLLDTIEHGGDGYCLHATMERRTDTSALLRDLQRLASAASRPPPRRHDVVHFDVNPANVVVRDGRLAAIIDWNVPFAGAAQGDRGFDVATLLFYLFDDEWARAVLRERALAISGTAWTVVHLCHLVLRQVEWTVRHHPGTEVEQRYLRRGSDVLDECERLLAADP